MLIGQKKKVEEEEEEEQALTAISISTLATTTTIWLALGPQCTVLSMDIRTNRY